MKNFAFKKRVFLSVLLFVGFLSSLATAHAGSRSICGGSDEREPSYLTPFARLVKAPGNFGCTGTLISPSCMISAGHCGSFFRFAEFNVPPSSAGGTPVSPPEEHRYPVEEIIGRANNGDGKDWAVIRLGVNPITKELPGNHQGFLQVSFAPPQTGSLVRITGYGTDRRDPKRTGIQQTATGQLLSIRENSSVISYNVDTEPGNSGSTIIDESTGMIIGIHSTGYCQSSGGGNMGTAIAFQETLQKAIEDCLRNPSN